MKELIKNALTAVEDTPNEFKIEAFKIVLINLFMNKRNLPKEIGKGNNSSVPKFQQNLATEQQNVNVGLQKLAEACKISQEEIKNVIHVNENDFELVYRLKDDNERFLQVVGSLIILLSYEIIFKREWINSSTLLELLKKIGVYDKGRNFSTNLKNHGDLFLKKGTSQEYRLTTNFGRAIASKIFHSLSKGIAVTKNDVKTENQS